MKLSNERWVLPGGMDEMLPGQSLQLESLRREIFDLHLSWGYQPVHPPFVEFLESLLSTAGQDFDRQTFKMVDPLSGRMMGLRADMTPQVARIDAHQLGASGISRLFYLGTVIRAYGDGAAGHRSPLQLGAELFGHSGIDSDVEVIQLMLAALRRVGVCNVHLDIGHAGIFRSLGRRLGLGVDDEATLFDLLQKKAESDVLQFCQAMGIDRASSEILGALCMLNGDVTVLDRAQVIVTAKDQGNAELKAALAELRQINEALTAMLGDDVTLHFDLAELRGYQYHNGIVFAAYMPGAGYEIARGGRYDNVGAEFGRARAATGYSTDLKTLMRIVSGTSKIRNDLILAPAERCVALQGKVTELRLAGEVVVFDLAGTRSEDATGQPKFNRKLVRTGDQWQVEKF